MNKLRYYFASRKLLKAQAVDLQRQLQEAWDDVERKAAALRKVLAQKESLQGDYDYLTTQLHRLARERDEERRLRLAAEELREHYLEQVENEEE